MKYKLILSHKSSLQPLYTTNSRFKVGAEITCDLRISLPEVEDVHALIDFENDTLEAFGECIRVNKNEIKRNSKHQLHVGDRIDLFGVTLVYGSSDDVADGVVKRELENEYARGPNDSYFKVDDGCKKVKTSNTHINYVAINNAFDNKHNLTCPFLIDNQSLIKNYDHLLINNENNQSANQKDCIKQDSFRFEIKTRNSVSNDCENDKSIFHSPETTPIGPNQKYKKVRTGEKLMKNEMDEDLTKKEEKLYNTIEVEECSGKTSIHGVRNIDNKNTEGSVLLGKNFNKGFKNLDNLKRDIKKEVDHVISEQFNKETITTKRIEPANDPVDDNIVESLRVQLDHNDIEMVPPAKKDLHDIVVDKNIYRKSKGLAGGKVIEEVIETREYEITTVSEFIGSNGDKKGSLGRDSLENKLISNAILNKNLTIADDIDSEIKNAEQAIQQTSTKIDQLNESLRKHVLDKNESSPEDDDNLIDDKVRNISRSIQDRELNMGETRDIDAVIGEVKEDESVNGDIEENGVKDNESLINEIKNTEALNGDIKDNEMPTGEIKDEESVINDVKNGKTMNNDIKDSEIKDEVKNGKTVNNDIKDSVGKRYDVNDNETNNVDDYGSVEGNIKNENLEINEIGSKDSAIRERAGEHSEISNGSVKDEINGADLIAGDKKGGRSVKRVKKNDGDKKDSGTNFKRKDKGVQKVEGEHVNDNISSKIAQNDNKNKIGLPKKKGYKSKAHKVDESDVQKAKKGIIRSSKVKDNKSTAHKDKNADSANLKEKESKIESKKGKIQESKALKVEEKINPEITQETQEKTTAQPKKRGRKPKVEMQEMRQKPKDLKKTGDDKENEPPKTAVKRGRPKIKPKTSKVPLKSKNKEIKK